MVLLDMVGNKAKWTKPSKLQQSAEKQLCRIWVISRSSAGKFICVSSTADADGDEDTDVDRDVVLDVVVAVNASDEISISQQRQNKANKLRRGQNNCKLYSDSIYDLCFKFLICFVEFRETENRFILTALK